jgi:hypothetical protein
MSPAPSSLHCWGACVGSLGSQIVVRHRSRCPYSVAYSGAYQTYTRWAHPSSIPPFLMICFCGCAPLWLSARFGCALFPVVFLVVLLARFGWEGFWIAPLGWVSGWLGFSARCLCFFFFSVSHLLPPVLPVVDSCERYLPERSSANFVQ